MTQLALSVRFAASLVNLHESDLKLLVLDDLLVSLDMSNRMKVVEILHSDTFENYQKIILTHDLGLFREFQRHVGLDHCQWCCVRLKGSANEQIKCINEKSDIAKAQEYLDGYQLEEAAHNLRKAAESLGKRYRELLDGKALPPGEFHSLTENLKGARKYLLQDLQSGFYLKMLKTAPKTHRELVIPADETDIDANDSLDAETKGRLKSQRRMLRKLVVEDHADMLRRIEIIDKVLACAARVLNPAAHAGDPPIYEKEVEDALNLVKQLASIVSISPPPD